jgi:hypothetical protein
MKPDRVTQVYLALEPDSRRALAQGDLEPDDVVDDASLTSQDKRALVRLCKELYETSP